VSAVRVPLKLRLKLAGRGLLDVLAKPSYAILAAAVTMLVAGVLLWLLNFNLLIFVLRDQFLTPLDKLLFVLEGYVSIVTNFEVFNALSIAIISVLMGLTVATAVYIGRSQVLKAGKRGAGAMVSALVGSGCAVCGTSLLGPLLSGLAGGAAASATTAIGYAANILAIGLLSYSLVGLAVNAKGSAGALK
jgi:hypothetical protein